MTLYPSTQGQSPYKLLFTSQSCMRDNGLEGNVGRCGFPGTPCIADTCGQDNCTGGAYCEQPGPKSLIISIYNQSQIRRDQFA